MAEQFLEEIYSKAMIIQLLREYVGHIYGGRPRDARCIYNQAAKRIEDLLTEAEMKDPEKAKWIYDSAIEIRDAFEDMSRATGIAEGKLIPAIFRYMCHYAKIDVTEGNYSLFSAQSGFLTIRDLEKGITFHSEYDPLWEAERMVSVIYDQTVECYHILGVGLGYLPYQLWRQSEGAVRITVYEDDETILDYAKNYGVLDWIKEDSLEIVCEKDRDKLGDVFLNNVSVDDSISYISNWKIDTYKEIQNGQLYVLATNAALERSLRLRTAVNIRKNQKHLKIAFDDIKNMLNYEEWIIVSAGPSLDDQISFLKKSKGERGIIAVNTVLRRVFEEGIRPDLVVAADQYVQMKEHIEGIGDKTEGIPMIAEKRTNWQYTEQYRGPICFVSVGEESADGQDDKQWKVSGSVAGLAVEAAVRLKAKKIYLVGQDLAYPDGKSYAAGMPYVADASKRGTMLVPSVDGGMVPTSEAFNWFRIGIETQIARYRDVEFVNLSMHGAFIKGCVINCV